MLKCEDASSYTFEAPVEAVDKILSAFMDWSGNKSWCFHPGCSNKHTIFSTDFSESQLKEIIDRIIDERT